MKQHITIKQLNELKFCQKHILFDILYYGDVPRDAEEKVNIGKMIEILCNHFYTIDIQPHNCLHIGYTIGAPYSIDSNTYDPTLIYSSPTWRVIEHTESENREYKENIYCNTLWEAIKIILEDIKI